MKKIAMLAIAGTTSLGMFAAVPTASAAHCVKGDSPGFSYFGRDGREDTPATDASDCRDTGSPSERAPGRNR